MVNAEMVMALVEMRALLHCDLGRKITQTVPIHSPYGCRQRRVERCQLRCRILAPGGVAGLGDPDFGFGVVWRDCLPDLGNDLVPAAPHTRMS